MFERIFDTSVGVTYFAFLVIGTIFIIPVICMLFSSIKHKRDYELYANGEFGVAVFTSLLFFGCIFLTFVGLNTDPNEYYYYGIFGVSIAFAVLFIISFIAYGVITCKRSRYYGNCNGDSGYHTYFVLDLILDFITAIFDIFT